MKPFREYLKKNFRRSFWEVTGFFWIGTALLIVASLIGVRGSLSTYLIFLVITVAAFIVCIPVGIFFAPMLVFVRWMRDRQKEELELPDSH